MLAQARRRDRLARGIAFGVVMGVCSIAIHSSVDFNLQIPANAFAFMLVLALGWVSLFLERKNRVQSATEHDRVRLSALP